MQLEDRIFAAYIELKSGPLVSGIKLGMFAGDFSWSRCGQPIGVYGYLYTRVVVRKAVLILIDVCCMSLLEDTRDYVKTVILDLVIIHAQVGDVRL